MSLEGNSISNKERALLTTMLIDQREQGIECPQITMTLLEEVKNASSLSVHERGDRLLRYLSNLTSVIGELVTVGAVAVESDSFGSRPILEGPTYWNAMAWSEAVQASEVQFLMNYLLSRGLIEGGREGIGMGHFRVTVDGYSHLADQKINVDLSQVFVAMWFDDSMAKTYRQGIEPAIRESGYKPLKIDLEEHINKIEDEIIAGIRRSRFLVADFTQQGENARGSVYYEAGFAHGLGLPVIFTCHKDNFKNLHFDTSHYNHIEWANHQELREKLKNRILAVIGVGPEPRSAQ